MSAIQAPPETPELPLEEPAEELEQTPVIDIGESAEEPAEEPQAPDPIATLQSKIDQLTERIESMNQQRVDPEAVRQAERQRVQMEEQQKLQRAEKEQADREELHDAIRATLISNGYSDVDPEAVRKVSERFINKRYDQIAEREISNVSAALKWVREFAEKGEAPAPIQGRAAQYAGQFADDFNAIYSKLAQQAQSGADLTALKHEEIVKRLSADQIKAITDNEISRRNAVKANGTKPLRRPDGVGEPASAERGSLAWWDGLTPDQRKQPANQKLFDDWVARNK